MSDTESNDTERYTGPTVDIPTNWQARKIARFAKEQKEQANTQASKTHWSQVQYRIEQSLDTDTDRGDQA